VGEGISQFVELVKDSCWKEKKVRTMMLEPILMVKNKIIMFHVMDA
jgi:hypothetical protein